MHIMHIIILSRVLSWIDRGRKSPAPHHISSYHTPLHPLGSLLVDWMRGAHRAALGTFRGPCRIAGLRQRHPSSLSPPTAVCNIPPLSSFWPACCSFHNAWISPSQMGGDPTARRPTKICDPYGQGGKPLSHGDATGLMATVDVGWAILLAEPKKHDASHERQGRGKATNTGAFPLSLFREFYHDNFVTGSRFLSHVAAVGHLNNHYPFLSLERRLMKREKAWRVVTCVKCFTPTLGGLSYNDFHLAMLIDVEVSRPEVSQLVVEDDRSLKKHT